MIKGRRIVPTVTMALAVLMGLPSHASAMSQIPFRAILSEVDRGEAPCPASQTRYLCVTITGTGQATHLGAVQESAVIVVDLSTLVPATGCAAEKRTSTLAAANGDQITLQGPGQACGPRVGVATAVDSWTVVPGSGTGRFAGATGNGTNSVSINRPLSGTVTSVTTFTGTISSPGSLR